MGLKSFLNKIFGTTDETGKTTEQKVREGMDRAGDYVEKTGKELREKSKPILDKMQDTSEVVGKKVMDSGKDFMDNAGEFTEDIGRKVLDATDQAWKTMQDSAKDIGQRILNEDKTDKADTSSEGEKERGSDQNQTSAEKPKEPFVPKEDPFKKYEGSNERSSHMDALKGTPGFGSGSFFDKAGKFADGDFDGVKDEPNLSEDTSKHSDKTPEEPKQPWNQPVKGFEDGDGDGDPVIDDAIIINEEE